MLEFEEVHVASYKTNSSQSNNGKDQQHDKQLEVGGNTSINIKSPKNSSKTNNNFTNIFRSPAQ